MAGAWGQVQEFPIIFSHANEKFMVPPYTGWLPPRPHLLGANDLAGRSRNSDCDSPCFRTNGNDVKAISGEQFGATPVYLFDREVCTSCKLK